MSFWSKIFKKKEALVPFDFSLLAVDMHSHLIPAIDDGAESIEKSLTLINGLINLGYKGLVTTPHIMSDFYRNTPEIIESGLKKVRAKLQEKKINIPIAAAAEYYIDFDFAQKIGKEKLLTFGSKNYILVECSFVNSPQNLNEVIFNLQTSGYKVVLAHPERYLYWYKNRKIYEDLKERGVLFQVNILSLAGMYSAEAKELAEYLIQNDMANFLATDLHNHHHLNILKNLKIKENIAKKIEQTTWLNTTIF